MQDVIVVEYGNGKYEGYTGAPETRALDSEN
jgi:hypothetical protein